jgi:hypothetical protein
MNHNEQTINSIISLDQVKKDEKCRKCSTHGGGGEEEYVQCFGVNAKRKETTIKTETKMGQ